MSQRLFVAVATGQNIANLPPLLEHAEPGDKVVWVESQEARNRNWSHGTKALLTRRGYETLPDIEVQEIDDLAELVAQSHRAVSETRRQSLQPVLILNGGQKLTPVGLLRAWGELNPVLLYGEQLPAVCKTFAHTLDRPPEARPYVRHTLDLPEILEASGYQQIAPQATRFWPAALADDLAREPYGTDVAHTQESHRIHHLRGEEPDEEKLPAYRDTKLAAADAVHNWKQALLGPLRKRGLGLNETEDGVFETIYNSTLGVARAGAKARARAARSPLPPLGPAFERAVARRVHAWLEASRHPAIQSAWRLVKVAERRTPTQTAAEFDVLLVLKNGVLFHLECKSFEANAKDLDARLFNLQQAGSKLARLGVCAPVLTGSAAEPWFAVQHNLRRRLEERRVLSWVPFTLPGQPNTYLVEEDEITCPTLEVALAGALRGYRSAPPEPRKEG